MHPRSGAGSIKHDASDKDFVFEVKDANKVFSLKATDLESSRIIAVRQGKRARWIIKFSNGTTADIIVTKE